MPVSARSRIAVVNTTRYPIAESRGLVEVCEAAVRLFAERGYHATGMQDIASELGVRAPSLYNYVDSKQSLLDMVYLQAVEGMSESIERSVESVPDIVDKLERGMEEKARWSVRHPYHLRVVWHEPFGLSVDVRNRVWGLRTQQRERWESLIREGCEAGRISTSSVVLCSYVLHEMCSWPQIARFAREDRLSEEGVVRLFGQMTLDIIGARPRPEPATTTA
jgi:AcrR family transcriptional regulator